VSQFPLSFPYILVWGFDFAYGGLVLLCHFKLSLIIVTLEAVDELGLYVTWTLEHPYNHCARVNARVVTWLRFNFFTVFVLLLRSCTVPLWLITVSIHISSYIWYDFSNLTFPFTGALSLLLSMAMKYWQHKTVFQFALGKSKVVLVCDMKAYRGDCRYICTHS